MISGPPPPPPPALPRVTCTQDAGSGDDISLEKVKATLRQQRVTTGSMAVCPQLPCPTAEEPDPNKVLAAIAEPDPNKVLAAIAQTRACAIKNAKSSEKLREAQSASPGRGTQTGRFRLRPTEDGQDGKEKST